MKARAVLALAGLAALAVACELVTHANEYEVTPAYEGLCTRCKQATGDLRHPVCPTPSNTPDDGQTHVYAARKLYFGADPNSWRGANAAGFKLGFDIDCSARPDGRPVLCQETDPEGGPKVPWEPMPYGIDNALAQRLLEPLTAQSQAAGMPVDLDAQYSMNQELGRLGLVVVVDSWNGTADDPSVFVRVASSPGVAPGNGLPKWDGSDIWDEYNDVAASQTKFFRIDRTEGYVSGGNLVVDFRSRGDVSFRFGSDEASFRIIVSDVFFSGAITKERIDYFTMMAIADVPSTFEEIPQIAKVLSACNPLAEVFLKNELAYLLVGAADMPRHSGRSPAEPCDGISFSWAFDVWAAKLGGKRPLENDPDAGCL